MRALAGTMHFSALNISMGIWFLHCAGMSITFPADANAHPRRNNGVFPETQRQVTSTIPDASATARRYNIAVGAVGQYATFG
jgi:hypothetical protein